ncbi:MAG: hypothetical protein V4650_09380 [Pseudomonadota bacterium]
MSTIAARAEVLKLTRLLGADEKDFAFLAEHDPLAIRALREQMTAQLYDDGKALLQKVATATKLTPTGISAVIAEKALGPLLCARVASLVGAEKAIDISKKLSAAFLAETCLHLDPRRTADIIRGTPIEQVVAVSKILQARKEFVTMARFVDALTPEAIKAVINSTPDEEPLLRTAVFAENPALHNELVSYLPKSRLKSLIAKATVDAELWSAALSLMSYLNPQWKGELGQLTSELDDATLAKIIGYAQAQQLWSVQLPVIAATSVAGQKRMLANAAINTPKVLDAIAAAGRENGAAAALETLKPQMPAAMRSHLGLA